MIHPLNAQTARAGVFLELIVAFILVGFAALRPIGLDADSLAYQAFLERFYSTGHASLLTFEPTFWLFAYISKWVFASSVRSVFIMYALVGVPLNIYAIKKVSTRPDLSIFIYMCLFFVLHEMTQMRIGIACALFLLSVPDAVNRRPRQFFLKILLASMFHYAAVVAFPLYFLNATKLRKGFYFFVPIAGIALSRAITIAFLARFGPLSPKIAAYVTASKLGEADYFHVYNLYIIGLLVGYYFVLLNVHKMRGKADLFMTKAYALSLGAYFALSIVPTFAVRISEFLSIVLVVLLAHATQVVKDTLVSRFVVIVFVAVQLINLIFKQHLLSF